MFKRILKLFILPVLMFGAIFPVFAQQTYTDPTGNFTTQIPAGWTDKSTPEYGFFTNSSGVSIYLLQAKATDVQIGIEAAFKQVVPDFSAKPTVSSPVPAPNGNWTQNVYINADGSLDAALGQVKDGVTYVMLLRAPNQAVLQTIQSDVNSILLHITVGVQIDLSSQPPAEFTPAMLADFANYVSGALKQYQVNGAAVAIVENDKVIYTHGFGTLEQGGNQPVDAQTLFMIGSTTKSMTTMMIGTLIDDGKLAWDTPETDLIPDFALSNPAATAKIRVRDLFNMSSGVPRFDIPLVLTELSPEGVVQEIARIPLAAQPGEQFHYSNYMVALGGFTGAVADGASLNDAAQVYGQLMQQRVFDPIGMSSTTLNFNTAVTNPNHAQPYAYDPLTSTINPVPLSVERFVSPIEPAGAVWSNATDMGKYLLTEIQRGVAPDGTRVVSEANLSETWKPGVDVGDGSKYGMGWMIGDYHGQRLIQHGGNTSGFTTDFAFLPDAKLGVVVLSNGGLANNFVESVREYAFEQAFGLEHQAGSYHAASQKQLDNIFSQIVQQLNLSDQPVDAATAADAVGTYELGVEVYLGYHQLLLNTPFGDFPLLPTTTKDRYVSGGALTGYAITFAQDAQKQTTMTIDSLLGPITGEPQTLTLKQVG